MKDLKYIYGPVSSWRLGRSLGIDLIANPEKSCSFDCIYCQVGRAKASLAKRQLYVPTENVIEELKKMTRVKIDYLTFSGRGEPTLAKNLGQVIKAIKKIRKEPVAVLTNSSLIDKKDVRRELALADFVIAKLDACWPDLFVKMNHPGSNINFSAILRGLARFRKDYKGILALQIMFVNENKKYAKEMVQIARKINPDEIQINTPTRPSGCKPLSKKEIAGIKSLFSGLNVVCVYDPLAKELRSTDKVDTMQRRGG